MDTRRIEIVTTRSAVGPSSVAPCMRVVWRGPRGLLNESPVEDLEGFLASGGEAFMCIGGSPRRVSLVWNPTRTLTVELDRCSIELADVLPSFADR